jgi:hypothetical protein
MIVGSGMVTIILPMGTQIHIKEVLLYPNSTRTLLNYKDIRKNGIHVETYEENIEEFLLLTKDIGYGKKYLKRCLLSRLDCTIHTSNSYHTLHTK